MLRSIGFYTFFVLIYLVTSMLGALPLGVLSEVIRILAFAIPVFIGCVYARRDKRRREEIRGVSEPEKRLFTMKPEYIPDVFLLSFPVIFVIFIISFLTSLLLALFGVESGMEYSGDFVTLLLTSAIAPAILEEMLFRFLPILIIAPYSKKYAVIASALLFAVSHSDPAMIPYSLFAGAVFMIVDLGFDSVIPSFIMHFINNALSCVLICYIDTEEKLIFYGASLLVLALGCTVPILLMGRRFLDTLKRAFVMDDAPPSCEFL